jgi:MFS family permease
MLKHEWPLLFGILLDMVGFGMVLPDIQTRLESFGAAGWLIGAVLASYFLVQMLVSPLWGRVSDRIGRKPVLIICGVLSAVSMVVYGISHSVVLILLSRVLSGCGGANVVAAQAYLSDTTDDEARTGAMGRVGSAITAGLVLGPVAGGFLAAAGGHMLLGLAAAAASAVGALWIWLGVPSAPVRRRDSPASALPVFDLSLLRDVRGIRPLFALATVAFFALACLEGTFGRLIRHKLGYGPKEFGLVFSYEALLGVVVQGALLARVANRLAPRPLLRVAYLLQGAGLGLTPFMPNLLGLFAASTLYATGAGLANPTLNSLCSEATPEPRQGEMFGLLQSARSLGFLLGPVIGGVLFDWRPEAPYLMAGAVAVLVGIAAAWRGARRH